MGVNTDAMSNKIWQRETAVNITASGTSDKLISEDDIVQFNEDIFSWAENVVGQLRINLRHVTKNQRYKLFHSINYGVSHYKQPVDGSHPASSIAFGFASHGIYLHLGVGRGYNRENGTVVMTKKNKTEFKRHPVEWFNPIVKENIPDLENIVSNFLDTLVLDASKLLIDR